MAKEPTRIRGCPTQKAGSTMATIPAAAMAA